MDSLATAGIDVGKVLESVRSRAAHIRDNPYQCEWLQTVNQTAGEAALWSGRLATCARRATVIGDGGGGAVARPVRIGHGAQRSHGGQGPLQPLGAFVHKIDAFADLKDMESAEIAFYLGQQAEPDNPERQRGLEVFMESQCLFCHTIRGTEARGDVVGTHAARSCIVCNRIFHAPPKR